MKVLQVISESNELDEFAFTRKGKAKQAAKRSVKAEYKDMMTDLAGWMQGSGIKKLTRKDLKQFLTAKGYNGTAALKVIPAAPVAKPKPAEFKSTRTTDKKAEPVQFKSNRQEVNQGMYEAEEYLSRSQVKKAVMAAIQLGYKEKAIPTKKGAFAPDPKPEKKTSPGMNDAAMIRHLKSKGYKVTN